jgi:hypothetical protein
LTAENDIISGTDQNYTAGWKLTRTTMVEPDHFAVSLLRPGPQTKTFVQIGAGQQIYTPEDKGPEPLPDQHPYAGWLYLETVAVVDRGEGAPIDMIGLQLGAVGEASGARGVQNGIHRISGGERFQGWENQIGDQPGLILSFERRWTGMTFGEGRWSGDFTPQLDLNLGNVLITAGIGGEFRWGRNLGRPYGIPRNEPGPAGFSWFDDRKGWERETYVFAGAYTRAVGRKIWLDGRAFKDDVVTQESEPVVYDLEAGFVLPLPVIEARMTASYTRRSRTFEAQDEPRAFGSLSVGWRF